MACRLFIVFVALAGLLELAALVWWPPGLWSLLVVAPLVGLGVWDMVQTRHTILRNFPLVGHFRYLFETFRPEIQQYFIESDIDAHPIEREFRALVYQRAKGELETRPFGTERDVYAVGYEWASHSVAPRNGRPQIERVRVGGPRCSRPYDASLLNVSAMSFGALSAAAVRALNRGAAAGGFAHNTGEGGISPYHLEGGGDLIWQIGTGYFGCRTPDGRFDPDRFADNARRPSVRMIEIKLSQGAKPGHGGVLPGCKVTPEIAAIRGVQPWKTVFSPPAHTAFSTPLELVHFVAQLRELSGGKPVGIKLCLGRLREFLALCKAMQETREGPDFITVDGGEGGTGAAPIEFANSVGMPARDAWVYAHNALVGAGCRERVRLFASGKILTAFHMVRALALGADVCLSARGFMLALGCIQALRCNRGSCPTGITTHDPWLTRGLVVEDKAARVERFHRATIEALAELLAAMGYQRPQELSPSCIFRRVGDMQVRSFAELYEWLEPGALLDGSAPAWWRAQWDAARPDRF